MKLLGALFWLSIAALTVALGSCRHVAELSDDNDDGEDGGSDSDSDADSDTDADTDSDSDGDTDIDADTDSDTDADCGTTDGECCEEVDDLLLCDDGNWPVSMDGSDCWCFLGCELAICEDELDAWWSDAPCQDVSYDGGTGICLADEDLSPVADCEAGFTCTTPSGYEDGICLSDGTYEYCLRQCVPLAETGCDILHTCTGLIDSGGYVGGACIPNT
jgi:hypothetical protein